MKSITSNQSMQSLKGTRQQGFTLVELMIVVAVIGILASIAFQFTGDSSNKARRAIAKTALMDVQSRQEQYFINNKAFTDNMTQLGYATNPFFIDDNGKEVAQANSFYQISLTAGLAPTGYTIVATPQNAQAGDECGNMSVTHRNAKNAAKASCW